MQRDVTGNSNSLSGCNEELCGGEWEGGEGWERRGEG